MALITPATAANLAAIYKDGIDTLLASFGKSVGVFFNDTVEVITDTSYDDIVRDGNPLKPNYKQNSGETAPIRTPNYRIVRALIKHQPKDFENYGINVNDSKGIVRLKTSIADVPDLERCEYIIPNYDSVVTSNVKYRLLKKPFIFGLVNDGYATSFWSL